MDPPTPLPSAARRTVAAAFVLAVLASAILMAAAWVLRTEARVRTRGDKAAGYSYGYSTHSTTSIDGDHDFGYTILEPGSNTRIGMNFLGDSRAIDRLMEASDHDVLWFSLEDRDYVVRNPEWVEKARRVVAPMQELGGRQGRLGAMQGALGGQQARIGAQQARVGVRQGALAGRRARIATRRARSEDVDALREMEDEIDAQIEELGRMQQELSTQQEPLARQQEELGRRQSALGREMEELSARVRHEMQRLAEQAIAQRVAERVAE